MSVITFRSPVTRILHRKEWIHPAGSLDFRVTQEYDDIDFYWKDIDLKAGRTPRTHMATDIGCGRCGDPIVAMAAGIARRVQDNATALGAPSNALGIVIDHGSGITTEYWHLNGWTVASGQRVSAGQQIGVLGSTGLKSICHCHIEAKRNGVKFDPEPLMFGGSVNTNEDDMTIPSGGKHLVQAIALPYTRLRVSPNTAEGSRVLPGSAQFVRVYEVGFKGQPYTIGGVANDLYALVGYAGEAGFAAHGALYDYGLTPAGQGAIPAETVEVVKEVPTGITPEQFNRLRDTAADVLDKIGDSADAAAAAVRSTTP